MLQFNIPVRRAAPGFRPPPWGPPVGKTHPPAPGASVSSGSPSPSPAGPAQLALMPKRAAIQTSAPGHCCHLARVAGPTEAQGGHRRWSTQVCLRHALRWWWKRR